jgi:putative flippase GtrA
MTTGIRFARFNLVGGIGIGVQLATVAILVHGFGVNAVLATAAGVTAAVINNFAWHVRWTWRDRMGPGVSRVAAFARFAGANGVVSLAASVAMMPLLVGAGLHAIPANLVTITACGVLNFWLGNRLVFATSTS